MFCVINIFILKISETMSKKCSFCNKPVYRNNPDRIKSRTYIENGNETILVCKIYCNQECKQKDETQCQNT
jgi:hypothetical protein